MNVILECDSLIQLLLGLQVVNTKFDNCTIDLLMYNSMPNSKQLIKRLKNSGLFRNCFLVENELAIGAKKLSFFGKIRKFFAWQKMLFFPNLFTKKIIPNLGVYDYFVYCANGIFIDGLFNYCYRRNRNIKSFRYEGSLSSYLKLDENKRGKRREQFETLVKKIFHKQDLWSFPKKYFFLFPELVMYSIPGEVDSFPNLRDMSQPLKEKLFQIFDLSESDCVPYEKKFIGFEDGNLFYQNDNSEVSLFKNTNKIVGSDNLFVRLHPRRKENRFIQFGIDSSISKQPWEIILLKKSMDKKVFISFGSGSIYTSLVYFNSDSAGIYLFKCLNYEIPLFSGAFYSFLLKIKAKYNLKIYTPQTYLEYENLLKKYIIKKD